MEKEEVMGNEKIGHEIVVKAMNRTILEQKEEMETLLKKLAPLISKDNEKEPEHHRLRENRAPLSLLEVYLKKYRIQSF